MYERLFAPGKIGKLTLPNRIGMAPMGIVGLYEMDGRLSQRAIDYYAARARGGTGLIITGIFRVHRWFEQPRGKPFVSGVMTDDKMYITRLNELAEAVHDYGSKICVLLTAGVGRVANPGYLIDNDPIAPSVLPCYWDSDRMTRELTLDEIRRLVRDFEFSARLIKDAGIDAIELHGHEGYLLDQFQTPLWNKRKDIYGGDLDGLLRFPVEVIQAIKRGAGDDFPVIYRFGLTHYMPGGREIDEGLEIAKRLEEAGVDALDIDAGCYETWHWPHPPTTQAPGCMVDLAAMTKGAVDIPVMAVGKLGYPALAQTVLDEGKADFILLGRPLLADPDWPNKVNAGKLEDIRPCIGDHECLKRIIGRKYLSCSVNPAVGMEREFTIRPALKKKTVLVAGGGPAGMEAARVSALRGHRVLLWEKANALGGNLIPASVPAFKRDYRDFMGYLSTQVNKLGVAVELNKEATTEMILELNPDIVFIATGATMFIPEAYYADKEGAITAVDLLMGGKSPGQSLIFAGGGLIGSESALHFALMGKKVTVVEMLDTVASDMYSANRKHLMELMDEAGVEILTKTKVLGIREGCITITDKHGIQKDLFADTVALAMGMKSRRGLTESLKGKIQDVYAIGDCVEPRKVVNAIWEGFRKARLL